MLLASGSRAMSVSWKASRGGVGGLAGNDSRRVIEEAEAAADAMIAARQRWRSREQEAGQEIRAKPCRDGTGLGQS